MDAPADQNDTRFLDDFIMLETLDVDLYRATKLWNSYSDRTFGGHLVAQALQSAICTVSEGFCLHICHNLFVRPARTNIPIVYHVSRIRDGENFCARTVSVMQNGKIISTVQASFYKQDMQVCVPIMFQSVMPVTEHYSNLSATTTLQPGYTLPGSLPIEIRPVNPDVYTHHVVGKTHKLLSWIRVCGRIGGFQFIKLRYRFSYQRLF